MADDQILQNIQTSLQTLTQKVDGISGTVQTLQKNQDDTLEIVHFLKDNMASKDDVVSKKYLDDAIVAAKSDILTHIDGFIVLHQKLDTELTALRSKYQRLEEKLDRVMRHLHLETI